MPKNKKDSRATFQSYIQSNGSANSTENKVKDERSEPKTNITSTHKISGFKLIPNGSTVEPMDYDSGHRDEEIQSSIEKIESSLEASINSAASAMELPEPTWLPGELLITHAERVMKYSPCSDNSNGESGNLYITTFRAKFVPYHEAVSPQSRNVLKNKLFDDDDIILNGINSVYQITKGKRKRLSPGFGAQGVKLVEIHCKNFRTHSFGFSQKENGKKITDAIVHYSHPNKQNLMFAFDYKGDVSSSGIYHEVPNYQNSSDWVAELDRLKVQSYKVIDCNSQFMAAESLPGIFVVPNNMNVPEINQLAGQFEDKRIPVWCYTHSNGASLVRVAYLIPKAANPQAERKLFQCYQRSHPNQKLPIEHDLGRDLPGIKEIQSSYEKLCELCMPTSLKSLEGNDRSWYSNLESSKWLSRVQKCLDKSCQIVSDIVDERKNVVIKEQFSRDLSPLVSCLVQLLIDPHYRTTQGFQALIEREWVAMGHKFMDRMRCTNTPDSEQCPVFLLFLDCVYQLTNQFPSAFQFSEVYLVALWDSVCLGLFQNFIFNSSHDRKIAMKKRDERGMLSVWDWDIQYDREATSLFRNPLYTARTELSGVTSNKTTKLDGLSSDKVRDTLNKIYSRKLNTIYDCKPTEDSNVLRPEITAPLLKFWNLCYLRWLSPVEIVGGGSAMEYLQQCMLVEEILVHQYKANCLEKSIPYQKSQRPTSDLIFSETVRRALPETPATDIQNKSSIFRQSLSSSFPFTPGKMSSSRSFMGSPVELIVENSYIGKSEEDLSYVGDDSSICEGNN